MTETEHTPQRTLESLLGSRQAPTPAQIRDLSAYLENRLAIIGEQGDCAYERAMGTMYRSLLDELGRQLAESPRDHA